MKNNPCIVLFRQDLRTTDNPALYHAAKSGSPVLPVYILDDETPGSWKMGGASRVWLHHSLIDLQKSLEKLGSPLVIVKGLTEKVLLDLIKQLKVSDVYLNRCTEPYWRDADSEIAKNVELHTFNGSFLVEPWELKPKTGPFYKVYGHFRKALEKDLEVKSPLPAPESINGFKSLKGLRIEDLDLLPKHPDWSRGIMEAWKPGSDEAKKVLARFISHHIDEYAESRDFPALGQTSRLSPYLHFGEISPLEVLSKVKNERFIGELIWREFANHILYHFPKLPSEPYQKPFAKMPWSQNKEHLKLWQHGMTGYPIVDAGMRELWVTGTMHNRVRMIAASFLIKDLLIPWQEGEKWFWDTLVDADLANNAFNWQWVAGSGFDAAPYFRIFNPTIQGKKFDPEGIYIKKWIPELRGMPIKYIHAPWEAPVSERVQDYPMPIVDHASARELALKYYQDL